MVILHASASLTLKAKLFRGLADSSRLAILEALRSGPTSVGDVVAATGLSQPNVSSHLACLADCGLVARSQQGRQVFYALSDPRVDGLLRQAEELVAEVARGIYECTRYGGPERG